MAKAVVAYVHPTEVSVSFSESLLSLVMYDMGAEGYLVHENGKIAVRCATNGLVAARNSVVREFLKTDSDWLFWVDTDMGFPRDALSKLIAVADPAERPIVGALCFSSREVGFDGLGGYRTLPRPTIYDWVDMPDGHKRFAGRVMYPVNDLVPCSATGSACIVVHRSVYERITAHEISNGRPAEAWYECALATDGSLIGEDISLCMRAAVVGAPTHVYTGVRTSHLKPMWLAEAHYWAQHPAPPATETVAVLVAPEGRAGLAERFMTSLRASTGLATAYALVDRDDEETARAWRRRGATVLKSDPDLSVPQRLNRAASCAREPWFFVATPDVHFWPGWLDHAQNVADTFGAAVVGTNDLGDPRTMAGEYATHALVRRAYIRQPGASLDGPGTLASDAYAYWYMDELITLARSRGLFQSALGARVEHMSPLYGKATPDEPFRRASALIAADEKTFYARMAD